MEAIMISVKPQYCSLIANGKKTIEVRKSRPKLETPFKCYIYCTNDKEHTLFKDWIDPPFVEREYNILRGKGIKNVFHDNRPWGNANGKVIGEFVCNNITNVFSDSRFWLDEKITRQTLLTGNEIRNYAGGSEKLYGWHISSLQIYDRPKELSEFYREDAQSLIVPHTTRCNAEYPPALTREPYQINRAPQSWCYVEELKNDE